MLCLVNIVVTNGDEDNLLLFPRTQDLVDGQKRDQEDQEHVIQKLRTALAAKDNKLQVRIRVLPQLTCSRSSDRFGNVL